MRRQRRPEPLQIDARRHHQRRQPLRHDLGEPRLDHGSASGPLDQFAARGPVDLQRRQRRLVAADLGGPQIAQQILVVLEVHDVGHPRPRRRPGDRAAHRLAGGPADHHGRSGIQCAVEADYALRIGGQVVEAEELERRRPEGVGCAQRLARADGDRQAMARQLAREPGDMDAAVAVERPVGDEDHLVQGATATAAEDGAERGHQDTLPGAASTSGRRPL